MTGPLCVIGGYLAGSVPTAYLIGRWRGGIDIRTVGSGNMGATNVFRSVGRGAGLATLAVDILKGLLPVLAAAAWAGGELWPILTGTAAVAGHSASPWIGFRGGKGVATSAGVFLALLPAPMGVALAVFALGFALSRRVSVGSIAGAAALAPAAWAFGASPARLALAGGLALVVILRHAPNLRRLWRGEEPALIPPRSPKGPTS